MNKSKTKRGKRYTAEEKSTIIQFVDEHNAKNGRGGVATASRKFGVSQLTIASWVKQAGTPTVKRSRKGKKDMPTILKNLGKLHNKMAKLEAELNGLRKEYAALKSQL